MSLSAHLDALLDELRCALSQIDDEAAARLAAAILDARRVFGAGAGRSGLMVRAFAMRLMHLGLDTYVVGETTAPSIAAGDLLLIGSGSGSTASLVTSAEKARTLGATLALITIDPNSPIAQLSDVVLTIPAPTPKIKQDLGFTSIQPMGSLFEQSLMLTLDALFLSLMEKSGAKVEDLFARHANLE